MINKYLLGGLFIILSFSFIVIAEEFIILNNDREVIFEKEIKDSLNDKGITNLTTKHLVFEDQGKAQTCFTEGYNLPCLSPIETFTRNCTTFVTFFENRTVLSDPENESSEKINISVEFQTDKCLIMNITTFTIQEIEEALYLQEEEYLKRLGEIFIERKKVPNQTIISEGIIIIR